MDDLSFLGDDFNPEEAAEQGGNFDALKPGKYDAEVVKAEMQDNKSGSGRHLYIQWKVLSEGAVGRMLHDRLNIVNKSDAAQRIGRAQFGRLCIAAGMRRTPSDTDALVGKVVRLKVGVYQYNGEDRNEVKEYETSAEYAEPGTAPPAPKSDKLKNAWG